jgi:hypothetical protein
MKLPFDLTKLESSALTDSILQKRLSKFTHFPDLVNWLLGPAPARDAAVLRRLIETTQKAVQPERSMGWAKQLNRDGSGDGVRPEDRWERTVWRKWRPSKGNMPATKFHELAPWILSYQVPLYGKQTSEGWGKIDLIGVSPKLLPVVVEIKAENSEESPLAVVLEAVRYGIALRKLWGCGLREEWMKALEQYEEKLLMPYEALRNSDLQHCQLICAAPREYWLRRGTLTSSGEKYRRAWGAFRELCAKIKTDHGFPVKFVNLEFSARTLEAENES